MTDNLYVGIDIGGSLTKVSLLSKQKINQTSLKVSVKGDELYLHSERFQKVIESIEWIKNISLKYEKIVIGATGGGAVKYDELLRESFPSVSISMHNQFESNIKGLQFLKQAKLPVDIYKLHKHKQYGFQDTIQINTQKDSKITDDLFPIIFVSYGSGANFHKIAIGSNGLQRQKVDNDLSIDGYMLDGTCLGAGYIYGLISCLSGEPSNKIESLLKSNSKYKNIGKNLLQNSLQIAITLSDIHKAQTIMPVGSILSVIQPSSCFHDAFRQIISPLEHRKNLIQLRNTPGFLGAVGVLYSAMISSK